jgi:hypothetical protein
MWAGDEILLNWDEEELPIIPLWVVVKKEDNVLITKKHVQKKIKFDDIDDYEWKLIFIDKKRFKIVNSSELGEYRYKIRIPKLFLLLLNKIKLFSVIHDYWSFSMDSNPLRVQQIVVKNKDEKEYSWVSSDTIPFGRVDVTYSPDQSEFVEQVMKTDLQLSNLVIENRSKFDNSVYYVAKENKETFLLYTPKVASKITGRGINL